MNKTKIEWVKNPNGTRGYTWNPITGCLNNCEYCYARKLANGRLKPGYLANDLIAGNEEYKCAHTPEQLRERLADPFYPRFWPERLKELMPIGGLVCELVYPPKTRKGIFVCDMSDLFGIGIPEEWTQAVLNLIKKWPAHRFYLLTKQPQNLIKFSPFPDNCWVGVTITEPFPDNTPLAYLAKVEANIKFISFEPLLKWTTGITNQLVMSLEKAGIDWVIIGAQTNLYKPPKIEWVKEIVKASDKAGIPVFLKNNLIPLLATLPDSAKASLFYSDTGLRQEFPK